jgi:hypothetical protein
MQSRPTRHRRFFTMFAGTTLIAGCVTLLTAGVAAQAAPQAMLLLMSRGQVVVVAGRPVMGRSCMRASFY